MLTQIYIGIWDQLATMSQDFLVFSVSHFSYDNGYDNAVSWNPETGT